MQGYPTGFWAKLLQDKNKGVLAWHPIQAHCADVAACAEALLARSLLRSRLARLAGLADLSPRQCARLCVLIALHDAGKYNHGFQNKASLRKPLSGHLEPLLALLFSDSKLGDAACRALHVEQMQTWCRCPDEFDALLHATISHHGHPVKPQTTFDSKLWTPAHGLDPLQGLAQLGRAVHEWFPLAFEPDVEPIPVTHAFTHAFSGLVMLADWMGSDTRQFPFEEPDQLERMLSSRATAEQLVRTLGLDAAPARAHLGDVLPSYQMFCGQAFTPRAAQQVVERCTLDTKQLKRAVGSLMVLEADTGSGKTEAAILHFLRLFAAGCVDGLYFALPTRTSAIQLFKRVSDAIAATFPKGESRPPVVLAVPGYLRVDDAHGTQLAPFEYQWPDDMDRVRGWAAEHPKRYLAGAIVVGTIDQVLLSSLQLNHAHMRGTALLRQLLVIDEIHASDTYMGRLVEEVLRAHLDAGGHALLMSATLGSALASRLLSPSIQSPPTFEDACALPYPFVRTLDGARSAVVEHCVEPPPLRHYTTELAPLMTEPQAIAQRAVEAASRGASVLIIRNTVRGCVEVQRALEALLPQDSDLLMWCRGKPAPHHARFAPMDRRALDAAVEELLGKQSAARRPVVIVATQTVEQSLDIDADLLITDLCPADVLIQRLGRLHRHLRIRPAGFEFAHAVILVPAEGMGQTLRERGEARGPHGIGTVYSNVLALEATRQSLESTPKLELPTMSRSLVEAATHPKELERLATQLGGRWPAHWIHVSGETYAERGQAHAVILDRNQALNQLLFPRQLENHVQVQTRLGEGDHGVTFKHSFISPFGESVEVLRLPFTLIRGTTGLPEEASHVVTSATETRFHVGPLEFRYDNHGLHRINT